MLFLGTEKYPEEGSYKKFLTSHAGKCNASTAMEQTTYIFDVEANYLEPALDMFSQFFVSPLFSEDSTDREMNAVHSGMDFLSRVFLHPSFRKLIDILQIQKIRRIYKMMEGGIFSC